MRPVEEIKADAIAWWRTGTQFVSDHVSAPDGREVAELCEEVERLRKRLDADLNRRVQTTMEKP